MIMPHRALAALRLALALGLPLRAQEGVAPNAAADSVLARMLGSWHLRGQVTGDSVTYEMNVRRTLGGRFFEWHMRDLGQPSQYEARVFVGADTGASPEIIVHWMDSFGAAYSAPVGLGRAVGDSIQFTIDYSTGQFRDVLSANADGTWNLRIDARDGDGWKNFAEYRLTQMIPAPARVPAPMNPPPALEPDSLTAEVNPRIANMDRLRANLGAAASRLVNEDETLMGSERSVRVTLIVDADGRVVAANVTSSSGNRAVDAAALRIATETRFIAGTRAGRAVPARVVVPIRFVFPED